VGTTQSTTATIHKLQKKYDHDYRRDYIQNNATYVLNFCWQQTQAVESHGEDDHRNHKVNQQVNENGHSNLLYFFTSS
jgi:hypothetical protein